MNSKRKRPRWYYKRRERAKVDNEKKLAKFAEKTVRILGKPYENNKLGRKPELSPYQATILILVMVALDKTFREAANTAYILFGKEVSYVSIWRYYRKLPEEYLHRAVKVLFKILTERSPHVLLFLIMDSTGISFERRDGWSKNHIIAAWLRKEHLIPIASCEATENTIADITVGYKFITEINLNGFKTKIYLLADSAFYSKKLRTKAFRRGFIPMVKEKKTALLSRRNLYEFDENIYTFRKVIEGIFGGTSIRYGNKTRCILEEHRRKWVILMNVAHNLREWMCLEAYSYSNHDREIFFYAKFKLYERYLKAVVLMLFIRDSLRTSPILKQT